MQRENDSCKRKSSCFRILSETIPVKTKHRYLIYVLTFAPLHPPRPNCQGLEHHLSEPKHSQPTGTESKPCKVRRKNRKDRHQVPTRFFKSWIHVYPIHSILLKNTVSLLHEFLVQVQRILPSRSLEEP